MSDIELKPCPFCGGKGDTYKKIDHWTRSTGNVYKWGAMCKETFCALIPAEYNTEQEAVEKWNNRTPSN